jgi:subtilisin family serine protease
VHLAPATTRSGVLPSHAAAARIEREGRRAQAPLLAQLAALQRSGHARHVRSLWIADAVAVTADASALAVLQARPDVRSIELDSVLPIHPADAAGGEPGVAATGAPVLWGNGIDGRGITVATLDTGVDLTHPELAGRYRGGANSWFDPYGQLADPMDVNGHGTEVMGVMVAGAGIGMAPGARFIAARVFNNGGVSTDSGVHLAFQWLLDPDGDTATDDAPDVVNASWGAQLADCDLQFQPDLQALRAAGILPVFAAGNDGATAPPSDTSPANLPEAFAVGATQSDTAIAPFSSVGPSRCGGGQFPALVAPGTAIRSTGRYGLDATDLAGTSFSAPRVAGALALLLQIAPPLTADQQAGLLTQSARDLGAAGNDVTFGAGALDVAAAARLLSPTLDIVPPVLSGATSAAAAIQIRADDAASAIAAAEWWADADPGAGAGLAMTAADGTLDSSSESLVASTVGLIPGHHEIGMRARDAAGNWSAAATLSVDIAAAPVTSPAAPAAPAAQLPLATAPLARAKRVRVTSDGFERGLVAWPLRTGSVAAVRAAAIAGRRGLRATSIAGAPAFVQRRLSQPSSEVELAFGLDPRTYSSAGAWTEIAAITSASGRRLASVEIDSGGRGPARLRIGSTRAAGGVAHSRPLRIGRGAIKVALSLDAQRVAIAIDGRAATRGLPRAGGDPAASIALGPRHAGPSASTGYLDIDLVTVRFAAEAS